MRGRVKKVMTGAAVAALLLSGAQVAHADPAGTRLLADVEMPAVALVDASPAGVLYKVATTPAQLWLQPTGKPAVRLTWAPTHLTGQVLSDDGDNFSILNGPVQQCAGLVPAYDRARISTGWVQQEDTDVVRYTATSDGCTRQTYQAPGGLIGAGDSGFAMVTTPHREDRWFELRYYRYSNPGVGTLLDHPHSLDFDDNIVIDGRIDASTLVIRTRMDGSDGIGSPALVPLDGSPGRIPPSEFYDPVVTPTAIGQVLAISGPPQLATQPLAGGAVTKRDVQTGKAVSTGASFVTMGDARTSSSIVQRRDATDPGTVLVSKTAPAKVYGVALSPGRVAYSRPEGVWMGSLNTYPDGKLAVLLNQRLGDSDSLGVTASAGRIVYDGKSRSYAGGLPTALPSPAWLAQEMSGNRAIVADRDTTAPYTLSRRMYDLRLGKLVGGPGTTWPTGPQDLFGNYLAYAKADGSVWRRDLSTGTEKLLRSAGTPIAAVAVHGQWVAWVTACPGTAPCLQDLRIREVTSANAPAKFSTRGTSALDLSGGYLALDTIASTARELRTIGLRSHVIQVVSTLPPVTSGMVAGNPTTAPRHFDLDDDLIAWTDAGNNGKVARLGAFSDSPKYLGNGSYPASFSPASGAWVASLPYSKRLTTCQGTIYAGSTKVRTLTCDYAETLGMVRLTWDGKNSAGRLMPKGTYRFTVTGADADGPARLWDGSTAPAAGTFRLS